MSGFRARRIASLRGQRGRSIWPNTFAPVAIVLALMLYWPFAGWRIEKTDDGRLCGIEKDLWRVTGSSSLGHFGSARDACAALAGKNVRACPAFTKNALSLCESTPGARQVNARASISPLTQMLRLQDTGPFAFFSAQAGNLWIQLHPSTDTKTPSVVTKAAIYNIDYLGVPCLSVGIGEGKIITAAHCVPISGKVDVNAVCPDDLTQTVQYQCDSFATPRGVAGSCSAPYSSDDTRDLAQCHPIKSLPPRCFVGAQSVQWVEPQPPQPMTVWVAGTNATWPPILAPADVVGQWPTPPGKAFLMATMEGDASVDHGDSGAPVFDLADPQRQKVVGISICTGPTARVVPLYLWQKELTSNKN
jgi:hypothetical protein